MKLNKKGFTIVELVIVIAVIAILAAVLIPTFTTVTAKAKESAALQQAKNSVEAVLGETGGAGTGSVCVVANSKGEAGYYFSIVKSSLEKADADLPEADVDSESNKYYTVFVAEYEGENPANIVRVLKGALDEEYTATGTVTIPTFDDNKYDTEDPDPIEGTYAYNDGVEDKTIALNIYTSVDLKDNCFVIVK